MDFLSLLKGKDMDPNFKKIFEDFYRAYLASVEEGGLNPEDYEEVFIKYLLFSEELMKNPYRFEPFHRMKREPHDYHLYGLDFIRPLIDFEKSTLREKEALERINEQLGEGDNIILFANHQTEPDPQIITLMLENYPKVGKEMIFVAGHRVTTDPMAVPFSLGCNLLCIYSKRYVEHPPEEKEAKLLHNKKTMHKMTELLSEGGKCIYVAPSGGRDRADESGNVEIFPFNAASVEMFRLMAKQAGKKTRFYPLALSTYSLLPPPPKLEKELGEPRIPKRTPVHLFFGEEIDIENIPGIENLERKMQREARSDYIFSQVKKLYSAIKENS